jgi:hypothetical protein
MNAAQWKELQDSLMLPLSRRDLMVDGFKLTIVVELSSKSSLKWCLAVYINGVINWALMGAKGDCEERRRFWGKRDVRLYSAAKKANILKGLGKRSAKEVSDSLGLDKTYPMYSPIFNGFSALKSQLVKNNQSIELLSVDSEVAL